jgi:hypothetical protein
MKYHDYHLESYEVFDRGESITFNLVYGYQGEETDKSVIKFKGVALYHIINTTGTIITDIEEVSIGTLLSDVSSEVIEWNRMYGVRYWKSDLASYLKHLESNAFKAWEITSAIGFYGFVIAKEISSA